jgi:hypothetical protein
MLRFNDRYNDAFCSDRGAHPCQEAGDGRSGVRRSGHAA